MGTENFGTYDDFITIPLYAVGELRNILESALAS